MIVVTWHSTPSSRLTSSEAKGVVPKKESKAWTKVKHNYYSRSLKWNPKVNTTILTTYMTHKGNAYARDIKQIKYLNINDIAWKQMQVLESN